MQDQRKRWASAYQNDGLICVVSQSGLSSTSIDPARTLIFLSKTATDAELGSALESALDGSRFLDKKDIASFFDLKAVERRYEEWVEKLMAFGEHKSRRAVFKGMMHCAVEEHEGFISIRPTFHERIEAWSGKGISRDDYVRIPSVSSKELCGESLRLGFSRCLSRSTLN